MLTAGQTLPKLQSRGRSLSYAGIGLLIAATSVAGFGPTYYFKGFFDTPPLTSLVHVHAVVMTCWLVLFVTQSRLISGDRIDLHRRLGVAGGVLALAVIGVGYQTAIAAARHGFVVKGGFPYGPLGFLAISLADLVVFGALVAAALYFRWSKSDSHKRLMLLATVSLIAPGISRLPFSVGFLPAAGLATLAATVLPLICAWIDRRAHGRLHPAYLWGGGFLVLSQPARGILAAIPAWQQFAGWLTS
jgi:hypothetical protein